MSRVIKVPRMSDPVAVNDVAGMERQRTAQESALQEEMARLREQLITAARKEAEAIVQAAREEAERIVSAARVEKENLYNAAREKGEQEGAAEAGEQVRKEAEGFLKHLADIGERGLEAMRRSLAEYEKEIVRLALDIASGVTRDRIAEDHETVVRVAEAALLEAMGRQNVTIRVAAHDAATIRNRLPDFMNLFSDLEKIEVVEDERVEPGGCIVETASGGVDARIDFQLDQMSKEMLEE